jgi:nucleoside-diphosphate-sugar epimerase
LVVSLRLPAVYGPGAAVGARGVNAAAVAAGRGEPATLPYPSDERVCLAHVDDVAACMVSALVLDRPDHEIYNIGGTTLSYGEMVAIVKGLVPELEVTFKQDERTDLPYLIDDSAAQRDLGLRHRPVQEGMREVIEYSRVAGAPSA